MTDTLVDRLRKYWGDMMEDDGGECGATALYREAADTIEAQAAELLESTAICERMVATINAQAQRIADGRNVIKDARYNMESWGEYASKYFREKWDLADDLARLDAWLEADQLLKDVK